MVFEYKTDMKFLILSVAILLSQSATAGSCVEYFRMNSGILVFENLFPPDSVGEYYHRPQEVSGVVPKRESDVSEKQQSPDPGNRQDSSFFSNKNSLNERVRRPQKQAEFNNPKHLLVRDAHNNTLYEYEASFSLIKGRFSPKSKSWIVLREDTPEIHFVIWYFSRRNSDLVRVSLDRALDSAPFFWKTYLDTLTGDEILRADYMGLDSDFKESPFVLIYNLTKNKKILNDSLEFIESTDLDSGM